MAISFFVIGKYTHGINLNVQICDGLFLLVKGKTPLRFQKHPQDFRIADMVN